MIHSSQLTVRNKTGCQPQIETAEKNAKNNKRYIYWSVYQMNIQAVAELSTELIRAYYKILRQ